MSFVFPPNFLGAQYAYKTDPVNYTLFVYDTNNTAGDGYWDDLFDDGVIFNGAATYKAKPGGLPGFYSLNLIWSTKDGTDFSSVPEGLDPAQPAEGLPEYTDGEGFAACKFQQYLSYDPDEPSEGWGVFGEVGFGTDGNPLDALVVFGVAGTSPIDGRGGDRWGLAWSRSHFQDGFIRVTEAEGGALQEEWGAEAFYEAKITDIFRIVANVGYVRPRRAFIMGGRRLWVAEPLALSSTEILQQRALPPYANVKNQAVDTRREEAHAEITLRNIA